jgi:hypothetical protein
MWRMSRTQTITPKIHQAMSTKMRWVFEVLFYPLNLGPENAVQNQYVRL